MSDEGAPDTPKVSGPGLAACCAATADRQILSTAAPNASRQHNDRLPHSCPRDSIVIDDQGLPACLTSEPCVLLLLHLGVLYQASDCWGACQLHGGGGGAFVTVASRNR